MRRRAQSGHAAVEVALMAPWLFFLFVGILDFGFYAYAAIAVQNAARLAVLETSKSDSVAQNPAFADAVACSAVLQEMRMLPNVPGNLAVCTALPVIVNTAYVAAGASADGYYGASQVSVTYQSPQMIPIPLLLTGRMNLTRRAEARVQE